MRVVLPTCCTHRQQTFHELTAYHALRAETYLAPRHRRMHCSLCRVGRWLYADNLHKRPKFILLLYRQSAGFLLSHCFSLVEAVTQRILHWIQRDLQRRPVDLSRLIGLSVRGQHLHPDQSFTALMAPCGRSIRQIDWTTLYRIAGLPAIPFATQNTQWLGRIAQMLVGTSFQVDNPRKQGNAMWRVT